MSPLVYSDTGAEIAFYVAMEVFRRARAVQAGQTVVDTGPYQWVRHPSYTGMLITFAGNGLALGNGLSLACAVLIPCIGLVHRIGVDERALLHGLGDPCQRYASGRARLIPHVW